MGVYYVYDNELNILINNRSGKWLAFLYKNKYKNKKGIIKMKKEDITTIFGKAFEEKFLLIINEIFGSEKNNTSLIEKPQINYIVFNTTPKCNLQCKYCYAKASRTGEIMNYEIIVTAVRKYAEKIYPNKLNVLFHGGEALLALEQIKLALDKLKDVNNVTYGIQTNGVLLNNNNIEWLKKNNVVTGISIDGISESNNCLRFYDLDNFTNRIIKLLYNNNDILHPLVVVHKYNYKNLIKIAKEFKEHDINKVTFNLLWLEKERDGEKYCTDENEIFKSMKEVYDFMLECSDKNQFTFSEKNLKLLHRRVLYRKFDEYMCMNTPCGAGRQEIAIDTNGDIYTCSVLLANAKNENFLGNVLDENDSNNIAINNLSIFNRVINNVEDCCDCPYQKICGGGGCPAFIYNVTKDINGKSIYCNYYFDMITYIIRMSLEKRNKKILINFKV